MPQLIAPVAQARNDFDIFGDLAARMGCAETFGEGLDEFGWLRRLWGKTRALGVRSGVEVPDFEDFWQAGFFAVPEPDRPEVILDRFRADPQANPLATPSGRIELFSQTIKGFGYTDCLPHPAWFEPIEWLGTAAADELHLVTCQPKKRLHSQLFQVQKAEMVEPVSFNPDDAASRGIAEGDLVRIENARGACLGRR